MRTSPLDHARAHVRGTHSAIWHSRDSLADQRSYRTGDCGWAHYGVAQLGCLNLTAMTALHAAVRKPDNDQVIALLLQSGWQ